MIGALRGTILTGNRNPVIFMVNNVGYSVHAGERTRGRLSAEGQHTLYIHTHVRDDALDLYGFLTIGELDLFELLLTVPGIGPRTALAVIDRGVDPVRQAVVTSDVEFFTLIPRLGKKNAQKIIIELKSKLGDTKALDLTSGDRASADILEALLSMGFDRAESVQAIKKLDPQAASLEQKIRQALQLLGKG